MSMIERKTTAQLVLKDNDCEAEVFWLVGGASAEISSGSSSVVLSEKQLIGLRYYLNDIISDLNTETQANDARSDAEIWRITE